MKNGLYAIVALLMMSGAFAHEELVKPAPKKWEANAGLSAMLNTGNSVNQTIGGNALTSRSWDRNKVSWAGAGAYGRAKDNSTGKTTTNTKNWKTSLRYDRFITDPISIFGFGHLGQDKPAGFDARYGGALGFAHEIWKMDPNFFKYEAGFDYTREHRVAAVDDDVYSGRIFLDYKRKISKWATFGQNVELLLNIRVGKDVRLNSLTSITMKLTNKLAFQTGLGIRFDNQPVPGFKRMDTSTQAGLVLTFL